jgi:hypothetical protein
MILKSVMIKLDKDVFDERHMLELMSLVLSDLPYKFFFFVIEEVSTAFILLTIKFTYKIVKNILTLALSETLAKCVAKLKKVDFDAENENRYYVMGYEDP